MGAKQAVNEDDRKIWFPAKRFGWGWGLPCAWQGWVVMALYVVAVVGGIRVIDTRRDPALMLAWIIAWSALLGVICWLKGERPRWRWGGKPRD